VTITDAPVDLPPAPQPAALRCPRCAATVAPEQDWCLECGAPARTRLAPTPSWKVPIAIVALIAVAAALALAIAFASLTHPDGVVRADTATTAAPADPNATTAPAGP